MLAALLSYEAEFPESDDFVAIADRLRQSTLPASREPVVSNGQGQPCLDAFVRRSLGMKTMREEMSIPRI